MSLWLDFVQHDGQWDAVVAFEDLRRCVYIQLLNRNISLCGGKNGNHVHINVGIK